MRKSAAQFFVSSFLSLLLLTIQTRSDAIDEDPPPGPPVWPEKFHALLYMNLSDFDKLQITDLWYDWPNGRNVNLQQKQLGPLLHDVEWNNGTSYYYTLGPNGTCLTRHFEVGIPRPDFLEGATYLGKKHTDGFLCHVWEKVDFIWYYEDVNTRTPVRWDFYDGIMSHVMTFEVGVSLKESEWQAPSYCFTDDNKDDDDDNNGNSQWQERNSEQAGKIQDHSIRKLVVVE